MKSLLWSWGCPVVAACVGHEHCVDVYFAEKGCGCGNGGWNSDFCCLMDLALVAWFDVPTNIVSEQRPPTTIKECTQCRVKALMVMFVVCLLGDWVALWPLQEHKLVLALCILLPELLIKDEVLVQLLVQVFKFASCTSVWSLAICKEFFLVVFVIVLAGDRFMPLETVKAKVHFHRDMDKFEVEQEDCYNPVVDCCIWLDIRIAKGLFIAHIAVQTTQPKKYSVSQFTRKRIFAVQYTFLQDILQSPSQREISKNIVSLSEISISPLSQRWLWPIVSKCSVCSYTSSQKYMYSLWSGSSLAVVLHMEIDYLISIYIPPFPSLWWRMFMHVYSISSAMNNLASHSWILLSRSGLIISLSPPSFVIYLFPYIITFYLRLITSCTLLITRTRILGWRHPLQICLFLSHFILSLVYTALEHRL